MKPSTKEDWTVVIDAIEWFQQQLRSKSPEEVRAWISPTSPPQDDIVARAAMDAAIDALIHAVRCNERCDDKYTRGEIQDARRAIAALGEKQGVTFFKCTFDGDPPAPHKNWMDWAASRMYTNVLIRVHEFGVPVTDALGEKGKTR